MGQCAPAIDALVTADSFGHAYGTTYGALPRFARGYFIDRFDVHGFPRFVSVRGAHWLFE
jgi:hypothetical protein